MCPQGLAGSNPAAGVNFIKQILLVAVMETKILNILFMVLIVIMFIFLAAIILINVFDKEDGKASGLTDITGAMQSFEVSHKTAGLQYANVKTSERFDDKYFEYLEHIQESRDKTFMKGRVFLVEK
mgnify:CR=1 FL=1